MSDRLSNRRQSSRVRNPEVRAGSKILKCNECASTFHRLDHMKRHTLSRHTIKSHTCSFCSSEFSRGDVLRRHWRSCKPRVEGGHAIPERERGGKHKRACDNCASLRKACSGHLPCTECSRRQKQCTYRRLSEDELPPCTQAPENLDTNSSDANTHTVPISEQRWNLGPATFYPPAVASFARRRNTELDSSEGH